MIGHVLVMSAAMVVQPPPAPPNPASSTPPTATRPAATGAAATGPGSSERAIGTADELLVALETADKGIKTLEAQVKYMRDFGGLEGNNREDRIGTLWFRADYSPKDGVSRRAFTVDFTKLYVNDQVRDEERVYVFDGEWLLERDVKAKQVTRRRVVPPGQTADPLKIGEGPFPIPIGQKKDDILSRFKAELLPPTDGMDPKEAPKDVAEWVQLKLTPKKGSEEARDFQEVRLWYQKKDLLPRLARTTNIDGGTTEVFLVSPKTNGTIPDATFDTSPPPAGSGWNVDTTEYRKPVDRNP